MSGPIRTKGRVGHAELSTTTAYRPVLACGFAGGLTSDARNRLLSLGAESSSRPGDFLLREGDRSDHVLLLIRGRVKTTSAADNGYAVVLGIRGPGDLVGEMACLDGYPRSATVSALDPVLARIIPGTEFRQFVGREPGAGIALAELIASRLRAANRRRLEFGAFPVRRRLALVLVDLERWHGVPASQGQNQRDIDLALSQADLAGLVGSSLESAAKAIREFAAQDILRTRRRRVTILDCAALRQIAGQ
jgi:CRP/FNR family transcriptional regulator, cyclic AMP receptor protein